MSVLCFIECPLGFVERLSTGPVSGSALRLVYGKP
ncbi:Protein of unknown function [Pyronema omphalodes CBS 100304]|uniref:Uncharacterized protein n=1 Tax=Pyronema omphalodes (strain CBS 100304) TaxID=1076935 RepID=U4LUB1_PYROM|nr:Protein of unknown function [Pyronema omphalodes CBS 100304]